MVNANDADQLLKPMKPSAKRSGAASSRAAQDFILLRDERLKSAQIIRSEAEAEAAKLINQAVKAAQIEIK